MALLAQEVQAPSSCSCPPASRSWTRQSFETWSETVRGISHSWGPSEIANAQFLCDVVFGRDSAKN
ncbi:MAG: hypothetical protein EOP04_27860 [Proteobacteria bacterium]|nr:MAG: hypothetical protein EOP04_27860 [Pseudomonadota bacterium]